MVAGDFVSEGFPWLDIVNMNVEPVLPDPPVITGVTPGSGQFTTAFDPPADQGTGPVTSYTVTYTLIGGDGSFDSVTGTSSPITVTGLTNGQYYRFEMAAANAVGTSETIPYGDSVFVGGSAPQITHPPDATAYVGQDYDSTWGVTGFPLVTFELVSGQLPLAFALGADGTLSGTPTEFSEGSYTFTVEASNAFGSDQATATITVVDQTTTEEPSPETGVQRVRARVCTKGANDRRECATRTLFGNFPQLKGRAAASLVRGPVTYATGRVRGDGRLILRRRCEPPLDDQTGLMESEPRCEVPFGRYTLVLRRHHRSSIMVPVTLH